MKAALLVMAVALSAGFTQPVSCEVLQGVEPLSSLGEIKRSFPNALFQRSRAAWVKEDQAFFSMTGQGFPGKLYLAFDDPRPYWQGLLKDMPPDPPSLPPSAAEINNEFRQQLREKANRAEDEALQISWVRWVPPAPIPMERVRAKFGDPSKCDFDETDFTPECKWESRALSAQMSDDRKAVEFFTTHFTKSERRSAYKRKGLEIPSWLLKEEDSAPKKPAASGPGSPNRKVKPLL